MEIGKTAVGRLWSLLRWRPEDLTLAICKGKWWMRAFNFGRQRKGMFWAFVFGQWPVLTVSFFKILLTCYSLSANREARVSKSGGGQGNYSVLMIIGGAWRSLSSQPPAPKALLPHGLQPIHTAPSSPAPPLGEDTPWITVLSLDPILYAPESQLL